MMRGVGDGVGAGVLVSVGAMVSVGGITVFVGGISAGISFIGSTVCIGPGAVEQAARVKYNATKSFLHI